MKEKQNNYNYYSFNVVEIKLIEFIFKSFNIYYFISVMMCYISIS